MEKTNEKEFSIGDIITLLITRKEVLEMKFTSLVYNRNIVVISFYDSDKNQISQKQLKFLCNYKNIVFDNILLITNLKEENSEYKIKIFNENISYMKLYIQTFNCVNKSENSFSQIFNLNLLKILTKEEMNNIALNKEEKNKNINAIISELENINKSLNERQKELDRKEQEIKNIDYNINNNKKIIEQKIIQFKEEMLLFKDKCYGECFNEINNKMKKLNKKMITVENNVNNKYKLIKEKLNSNYNKVNNINNNIISQEKKDKIANLEIKIKFLEDSINKYKEKNLENEEKIKNYIINEEKLNNNIKKLKDELILTNSQIKEKRLKMSNINSNMSISNISIIENKEKENTLLSNKKIKNKISFELDKSKKESILKYHIYNILFEYKFIHNFNDKEILSTSLLIMHLSTNPIALNNKFNLGHIILLEKLLFNFNQNKFNSFISLIKQNLENFYNKLPEFKNNIYTFITNNNNYKNDIYEFQPLIDININEINLSNIIFNKCFYFGNFLMKNNSLNNNNNNERKNEIKKFTIISNILISLLFCSTKNGLNDIIKQIIIFFSNYNKNEEIMKFLLKINLSNLLIIFFEKINMKNNKELIQNIFDCILYSISILKTNNNDNYEKDLENILNGIKFKNYLKKNIQEFSEICEERQFSLNDNYDNIKNNFVKTIIFITNVSIHCNNLRNKIRDEFMENINDIKNILKNKNNKEDIIINLIKRNISILTKIIYTFSLK